MYSLSHVFLGVLRAILQTLPSIWCTSAFEDECIPSPVLFLMCKTKFLHKHAVRAGSICFLIVGLLNSNKEGQRNNHMNFCLRHYNERKKMNRTRPLVVLKNGALKV